MTLVYTVLFNAKVPSVAGLVLTSGQLHERMALRPGLDALPYKLFDTQEGEYKYAPPFPFPVVYRHVGYIGPFGYQWENPSQWMTSCRSSLYRKHGRQGLESTEAALDYLMRWTGPGCRSQR